MSAARNPPGVKTLGMWLFVLSDLLTFATLLVIYTALRLANPEWPRPFALSPAIVYATTMTIVLLTSSLTMVWAVDAMQKSDRKRTVQWLLATILGGAGFIALHLTEWRHLIQVDRITPVSNPWNVPLFGAVFFGVTGLHMAHVAAGLVYLSVLTAGVARGKFSAEDVETGGLYWHFVDLVWMFVFPLVYLMAVKQ
ncbi:MAG: cytochrome c oxidase subunit 3 [Bryobacteraceae bacterium]